MYAPPWGTPNDMIRGPSHALRGRGGGERGKTSVPERERDSSGNLDVAANRVLVSKSPTSADPHQVPSSPDNSDT